MKDVKTFAGMDFPVESTKDNNVRLKLTSRCQWSCHFCHMEGLAGSPELQWSDSVGDEIIRLMNDMGRSKVHLTGGEPTIYPKIIKVVDFFRHNGKDIAITSNGQFSNRLREELVVSGCSSFSFSLPTLSPTDFIKFHKRKFSVSSSQSNIDKTVENILAISSRGLKTDINAVFSDKLSEMSSIMDFAFASNINISLLGVIGELESSEARISKIVASYNLEPVSYKIYRGTSRARYILRNPESRTFVNIKMLEPVYLESMCASCPIKETCEEKFYGIRIEQGKDGLLVRTCVHRNVLTSAGQFAQNQMGREIRAVCG